MKRSLPLTPAERDALSFLSGVSAALTYRVAGVLALSPRGRMSPFERAKLLLHELRKRGLVADDRNGEIVHWSITARGRKALAAESAPA